MNRLSRLISLGTVAWLCVVSFSAASAASSNAGAASAGTVLITGSSRGIGFEFARQYAAAGWTVIATARKPAESASLRELAVRYPNVRLEALDVIDGGSVAALRDRLRGVSLDVLINNAGDTDQFRGQSLGTLDHDRFDYLMRLNAQGPLRVTEALLPNLQAGSQKKIVAISSLAGSLGARGGGMPGGYWYKASKAALNMMVVSLALELQPKGFKVVALSPGQVDTQGYAARGIVMPGTVAVEQSVAGLRQVIDGLTPEQSGRFIRYSGEVQPW
ncbi:MAG: SDR family oxidoreductase [Gammaproteobacteria bacterium]|nr:SDR family oxidoreductase [Gammaproteobacteria bacterium]